MSSAGPVTVPIQSTCPARFIASVGQRRRLSIPAHRLWVDLFLERDGRGSPLKYFRCLLDTGAPVSVIPFRCWQEHGLHWERARPVQVPARFLRAFGVPCTLGRINVWLPHQGDGADLRGPFSMTAKFLDDPGPTPAPFCPPYPLLGLDFLAEHDASVHFSSLSAPPAAAGTITFA